MSHISSNWLARTDANIAHLRLLIRQIIDDRCEKQESFARVAEWDKSDFSRWLNEKPDATPLSDTRYVADPYGQTLLDSARRL
jgi:hypothetical protein